MARYAYTEFPAEKENAGLDAIIAEMRAKGILYVPDHRSALGVVRRSRHADREPARDDGRAQDHARPLRPDILKPGEPIGALRDMRLWMTYLHHRWAIEAGVGYVGGMYHNIVVKGDDAAAHRDRAGGAAARRARLC